MYELLKLKIRVNKANKQINSHFNKSQLPRDLIKQIERDPKTIKFLKVRFEGFE